MKKLSVAIDGPSGAGKSTIAKAIAKEFGFIYVDTGAIYRTVGLHVLRLGADPSDETAVGALLGQIAIRLEYKDGEQRVILNGEDVTALLRTPRLSKYASDVSAIPAVRAFLLEMQRDMAKKHCVVMDGRDIGTVVLPDADIKIFLTASPEERARRRHEELLARGESATYQSVLSDMIARDKNDSCRKLAPLTCAPDALKIDTTGNALEKSISILIDIVKAGMKDGI